VKPENILLVVDAMVGQDAVKSATAFHERIGITGVVLTKLDGDARGGAALSVRHVTGKPIKFVGVSEKMDGLEAFHPDRMASRILGMGDIVSLVEEARAKVDEKEAQKLADKFKKGKDFDLEDFKSQLQQMKNMGGIASLADKLPLQLTQMAQSSPELQEKALKRTEAIINSMTPQERRKPELLKASRKRRIAAGAGVQVQEVNRLLAQFEQMQKMMKMMRGGNLQKMMRNMKGMFPGGMR
jgi:signal recognition particle subunit SRP54